MVHLEHSKAWAYVLGPSVYDQELQLCNVRVSYTQQCDTVYAAVLDCGGTVCSAVQARRAEITR